ncbi:hypothetical protein DB88DRAFT_541316 [Papiliotrema laurentii]|uniref:YCII-related domain-containing protein n=1 Tax=Papiliotrema laurentii TaxID=5418 RepID=A0AAD9D1K8_PAPLA|nr:hypothetical protein DB88DRAFT_541316 [Papiliotrema laurentii]
MPRYLCYCPDYPDALERRYAVRPTHLERAKESWDSGFQVDGSPFLPIPGSEAAQQSTEDRHAFTGSFMIFVADDIEQVWARIKADVYWENNVWDKEKVAVHPLLK